MKDELFTMTPEMPAMSPEMLARWQEELRRNSLRMKHFSEMVMNPKEPEVGPTPREEIYRKGKSRLWRYASKRTHKTPLLFVPNLGISRPYIFDLMRKGSFIEHMTEQELDEGFGRIDAALAAGTIERKPTFGDFMLFERG